MVDLEFEHLHSTWEELAKEDPLWAILSVPSKKENKWNLEEFFAEGTTEVDGVIKNILALHPLHFDSALDFGCGVGRLTQALAAHFRRAIGVDISATMIALAKKWNRYGERVEYIQNRREDLAVLPDMAVEFVYSALVLQHMKPAYAIAYIKEFFRVTRPGGAMVFQVPSHLSDEYLPKDSIDTPLPPAACRAEIRFLSGSQTLPAGQRAEMQFQVTNISAEPWIQRRTFQLNLGNHWFRRNRHALVAYDDGRSRLPGRLSPGQTATIALTVTAPAEPGRYYLEVDVVQERVRWFKTVSSPTLFLPVEVVAMAAVGAVPPPKQAPRFLMEGIPRDDVLKLIADLGGRLLFVEQNITQWHSYKYYVAR